MKIKLLVILVFVLAGCSTHIKMIGEKREKVSHNEIKLLDYQYSDSEVIALIEVKGRYKYSKDAGERRGIRKAKRKAAKLGANSIVILDKNYDSSMGMGTYGNGMVFMTSKRWVNLMIQAVYVK